MLLPLISSPAIAGLRLREALIGARGGCRVAPTLEPEGAGGIGGVFAPRSTNWLRISANEAPFRHGTFYAKFALIVSSCFMVNSPLCLLFIQDDRCQFVLVDEFGLVAGPLLLQGKSVENESRMMFFPHQLAASSKRAFQIFAVAVTVPSSLDFHYP